MAALTRDAIRELVRAQVDMDDQELPDALLDPWLDDAYERTMGFEDRWPFFEHSWTVTTVADQVAYTKASLAAGDPSLYELNHITSLLDVTDRPFTLLAISHDRAEEAFGLGEGGGGVPAYWSDWGQSIHLWHAPSAGRSVRVRGYRKPSWALGDAVLVDADSRLHLALFFFVCSMVYAQQEDDVLSAFYMNAWQDAVRRAHATIMAAPQRSPVVLSGASFRFAGPSVTLVP